MDGYSNKASTIIGNTLFVSYLTRGYMPVKACMESQFLATYNHLNLSF